MPIYQCTPSRPEDIRPTLEEVHDTLYDLNDQFDDFMLKIDEQDEENMDYTHPDFINTNDELKRLAELRDDLIHLEARIILCLKAYKYEG